ncbi:MAG: bifunctional folylpolyglutamate synthase/dihydrofolate synthase [Paenibacillaceae bacterium ZCTH02-B3]|nr:MAG: bifunctional folylpolyglutamate synthase/dihydrofolate synthase [Paenibacillaceae bacterium ZCTH02-B3]
MRKAGRTKTASWHAESEGSAFRGAEEAVTWITGLMPTNGIRPGLDRIRIMMDRLGDPHLKLRFIHVAGTNGKGSVCAYLDAVLRRCGYDVGLFTSPYLSSYNDRFRYNGQNMPDDALVRLANRLKPVADELARTEWGPPTMFEVTTALALLYFATETFPDYVVWETGLGGRLDVTNIVFPVVSVITNVGHDHMDLLGPTLADVAMEKAGIIKPGVPVVSAARQPEAVEVLRRTAAERKATLYLLGDQFDYEVLSLSPGETRFTFRGPYRTLEDLKVPLSGAHQAENAATAVMTLELLRQFNAFVVEDEDLRAGLEETSWPGRLEMVSQNPPILLDGAHNPESMQALAAALRDLYPYDRVNMLLGMMPNKNHGDSLRHILPIVDTLVVTEPFFFKKMGAHALADLIGGLRERIGGPRQIVTEPDWRRALDTAIRLAGDAPGRTLTVVTGSLYLVADVRSWLLHRKTTDKGW